MNILNSVGERTHPCRRPQVTSKVSVRNPFTLTLLLTHLCTELEEDATNSLLLQLTVVSPRGNDE